MSARPAALSYGKGVLCGVLGTICYATNPLGSLFLYREGLNVHSVLCHRFLLAFLLLGLGLVLRRRLRKLSLREWGFTAVLGMLFGGSAYGLYASFLYLNSGLACSLLYVYPVMVALLMRVLFRERLRPCAWLSVLMAPVGVWLLSGGGGQLHAGGVALVMAAALAYAVYIVILNRSGLRLSASVLTFYQLIFCEAVIVGTSWLSPDTALMLPCTPTAWLWVLFLAVVPGIAAMSLLAVSIRCIGSTPAAVMGALQPLTAVLIGCLVFGESCGLRDAAGIAVILASVLLMTLTRSAD